MLRVTHENSNRPESSGISEHLTRMSLRRGHQPVSLAAGSRRSSKRMQLIVQLSYGACLAPMSSIIKLTNIKRRVSSVISGLPERRNAAL